MKSNPVLPLRNDRSKKSNKMWVSLMATLGVSAAIYGMKKYQNGKLIRPIQNAMKKMKETGMTNPVGMAKTPLTEFSKEFLATNNQIKGQK
ncbi:hypothetical protein [Bacillus sp. FSL K6-3431]|uniref:hypothetical protein n=1 Tax=Bacillus sp. FSL K6-3431 TaxID=2921500 RepID=UPI0030F6A772